MRLEHAGGAAPTTLTTGVDDAALGITLADPTGYPTGTVGPFVLTLDAGTPSEERVLATSRSGSAVVLQARGWDGTLAFPHSGSTGTVEHTFSATEADEANAHLSVTTGTVHGLPLADVLTRDNTAVVTNKNLTSSSNTFPATLATDAEIVAERTVVATLTNKNLTDPTNTFPTTAKGALAGGYAQATGAQTGLTTGPTDLTSLTVTVTVGTGRRIRVSGYTQSSASAGIGPYNALVSIYEGATEIQRADSSHEGTGRIYQHAPIAILTPTAGAHTYKLVFASNAGTWTCGATPHAWILVEDIGV